MKALVLAAGFGTRLEDGIKTYSGPYQEWLYSNVRNKPKGLIPVNRRPIIDYLLDQANKASISAVNFYVQTNNLFHSQFCDWARGKNIPLLNIFNNGVNSNGERKEQVLDLFLALEKIGYAEPVMVFASDTLVYDFSDNLLDLSKMVEVYQAAKSSQVVVYYKSNQAFNHGVVDLDDAGNLLNFREKPIGVESGWVNASIYLFSPEKLRELKVRTAVKNYKNPLEQIWDGFKSFAAARREDIGTIADVLKANGLE
ncbi:MAG TPA: sugar phosphate nucleotidyltransferase [Candidatus Nanoarchaeia archaeon]|nr:sugar phosphate nucleotidyltransferase [Candidatus Nanoarchaeia archaeon]